MGGGSPAETGDHGGQIVAAVEAVLELGEITRDVFVADGVEGAGQAGLEVAQQGVGPFCGRGGGGGRRVGRGVPRGGGARWGGRAPRRLLPGPRGWGGWPAPGPLRAL